MAKACVVGDQGIGVCPNHSSPQSYTTTISTGASKTKSGGKAVAIVGSIGISTCGHSTVAQTGSSKTKVQGQGVHRIGDTGANFGQYTMVSASGNFTAN